MAAGRKTGAASGAGGARAPGPRFDRSLLLVRYLAGLLGGRYDDLLRTVKDADDSGPPGASMRLLAVLSRSGVQVPADVLERAERAFMADWSRIAAARESATRERWRLTHFQWLAALFAELYLSRLAADRSTLLNEINEYRSSHLAHLTPVKSDELNRLALWMATGSGKTLMMHLNVLQFLRHAPKVLQQKPQRVLLLTPSEVLSKQHRDEFALSGIDEITLGVSLEVTELSKLYLPGETKVKQGVSVCTDQYAGPNVLLVDEGHKGGKGSSTGERAFRSLRQALSGIHPEHPVEGAIGFELEYSATFAQIADGDAALYNEYARCTMFDYGYRRFHDDGFGKTPKSLVTKDSHAQDIVLTAALIAFWRQCVFFNADATRAARYRVAAPLAVFVGQTVTGKSQDVVQMVRFLARFAGDAATAQGWLAQVLDAASPIQTALFSAQLDLTAERAQGAALVHALMCTALFGAAGALCVRVLSKDELGIRLPGAEADRWCGTALVGDAAKLAEELRKAGVTVEDDDAVTGSLFARLNDSPDIKFLIGSRKFIEGWSSYRVSTLGLLQIGKNAGTQVIQLFGRGVRLAGIGGLLKRADFVPALGPHADDIALAETLYVFGVKADYVQTWLEALGREGMPRQSEVLPVTLHADINAMALQIPRHDAMRAAEFEQRVVTFSVIEASAELIDLGPRLSIQDGTGAAQALVGNVQTHPAVALLGPVLTGEHLFQHALRVLQQEKIQRLWLTPNVAATWLRTKIQVQLASTQLPTTREMRQRIAEEVVARWDAALSRCLRRARLAFLTKQPELVALDSNHANFPLQTLPNGTTVHGYRIEASAADESVEAALAKMQSVIAALNFATEGLDEFRALMRKHAGELNLADTLANVKTTDDDDALGHPLPRLFIPQHLYSPLLLAATAPVTATNDQLSLLDDAPVTFKISPPALEQSEARFVWDLRRVWQRLSAEPAWSDVNVVVLRNLSGVGVGLFAAEGFFPDFLLWLIRGKGGSAKQALAFIEPKGLRHQNPQDKFELLEHTVPAWQFAIPVRGFMLSSTSEADIRKIVPGFSWRTAPGVLLRQDTSADYVVSILEQVRGTM